MILTNGHFDSCQYSRSLNGKLLNGFIFFSRKTNSSLFLIVDRLIQGYNCSKFKDCFKTKISRKEVESYSVTLKNCLKYFNNRIVQT